jgi:hypothetical protein
MLHLFRLFHFKLEQAEHGMRVRFIYCFRLQKRIGAFVPLPMVIYQVINTTVFDFASFTYY